MNKNFYGICNSADDATKKHVIVSDLEVAQQGFDFNKGDLLTVFFANGNTQSQPKLVIYIGDTEQETSTSLDSGKFVKTYDENADAAGAWGPGETVIFAYTKKSNTNEYYWELVNAVHASNSVYGVTTVFDKDDSEPSDPNELKLSEWIASQEEPEDSDSAITPNTIKRLFNLLTAESDNGRIGLNWEPANTQGSLDTLGTLSLNGGMEDSGIDIKYPLVALIDSRMGEPLRYTHQLENDGGPNDGGEPFITKKVPENLYFNNSRGLNYVDSNNNAHPHIILNDESGGLIIGDNSENSVLSTILLKNTTNLDGNLFVTDGHIVSAERYMENNVFLDRKYGTILEVHTYTTPQLTIPVGAFRPTPHPHQDSLATFLASFDHELEAVGIVGYNLDYVGTTAHQNDASYGNLWECHLLDITTNPRIEYSVRNLYSEEITLVVNFDILCRRKFS